MLLYSFHLAAIFIILCKNWFFYSYQWYSESFKIVHFHIFKEIRNWYSNPAIPTGLMEKRILRTYFIVTYFVRLIVLFFKWQNCFKCWHVKWGQAIFNKPKKVYRQDFFNSLRSRHQNTTSPVLTVQTIFNAKIITL
jgi:hypothetical protein